MTLEQPSTFCLIMASKIRCGMTTTSCCLLRWRAGVLSPPCEKRALSLHKHPYCYWWFSDKGMTLRHEIKNSGVSGARQPLTSKSYTGLMKMRVLFISNCGGIIRYDLLKGYRGVPPSRQNTSIPVLLSYQQNLDGNSFEIYWRNLLWILQCQAVSQQLNCPEISALLDIFTTLSGPQQYRSWQKCYKAEALRTSHLLIHCFTHH